ncbi:MAG TPA: ATP-binding protein [Actinomycetes bacterium]|nr:ATP-binding protein [Actinomycetes bacterium]
MKLRIIPSGDRLVDLRARAGRALDGVPEEVKQDVLLTLDEAVSNAIRHGCGAGGPVEVSLDVRSGWIEIAVVDQGPTPRLPRLPRDPPPLLATGGRGLWLIRQLSDDVHIERAGGGTRVAIRRRAGIAADGSARRVDARRHARMVMGQVGLAEHE